MGLVGSAGVSVIVITYNEEKSITSCLMSLLAMDYSLFEIIVVDASSDGTGDRVKAIRDSRLRYVHTQTKGFGLQRNLGIQLSRYPLVAFTDADCTVPEDWLNILVPEMTSGVGGVGGNAFPPEGSQGLALCIASLGFPAGGAIGLDVSRTRTGRQSIATCNAVFVQSVLKEIGGFDETLRHGGEDTRLIEEIQQAGYWIRYVPESSVVHRPRSSLRDFVFWNIRRGRAQFGLARNKVALSTASASLLAFSLIGCFLLIWATQWLRPIHLFWIVLGYVGFLTLFFTQVNKFRLLWLRRKRIGISIPSLLLCVPPLFILRRICIAIGVLIMMFSAGGSRAENL